MRIGLGSNCIELNSQDNEFIEALRIAYKPFLISQRPDFYIHFNLRNRLTASEINQLWPTLLMYYVEGTFFSKPELMSIRVNWPETTLLVETEKEIFAPESGYKFMNNLLQEVYSSIFKKVRNTALDAYLIHGCGVVDGGQCYLFTGPSGSGKTTIAKLANGRQVLNDEAVLISRKDGEFHLSGTPFDGEVSCRCGDTAKLSAIFFLKHDKKVSLRRLGEVEIYKRFLSQVFDTTSQFEVPRPQSLSEQADLCVQVAEKVPSYELGFLPDTSFWQTVEKI